LAQGRSGIIPPHPGPLPLEGGEGGRMTKK